MAPQLKRGKRSRARTMPLSSRSLPHKPESPARCRQRSARTRVARCYNLGNERTASRQLQRMRQQQQRPSCVAYQPANASGNVAGACVKVCSAQRRARLATVSISFEMQAVCFRRTSVVSAPAARFVHSKPTSHQSQAARTSAGRCCRLLIVRQNGAMSK